VRTEAEYAAAVATARAAARAGVVLVEELVDGPEVTVMGFSVAGAFVPLAVTDRVVADPPAFGVALAHVHPSPHGEAAARVAEAAVAALGIEDGPTYTQLRIDADGPKVIEVAARLGGGHDAELVEAAVGVPLNALAVRVALGEPVELPAPVARAGGAVTRFLVASPGVLEGVDVPEGLEGVERVRVYREAGHVVAPLRRGADRAGAVLAVGDSREQAVERAERAAAAIRFRVAAEPALAD
jgi:biotin carboxylase